MHRAAAALQFYEREGSIGISKHRGAVPIGGQIQEDEAEEERGEHGLLPLN